MISLSAYVAWILAIFLVGYVAFLMWKFGLGRNFPFLCAYLVLTFCVGFARFLVLRLAGVSSEEYMDVYYFSDLLLSVAVYLVVFELYRKLFPALAGNMLLSFAAALFVLLSFFSCGVAGNSEVHLRGTIFAYELSSKLFFANIGLTFLLWALLQFRGQSQGLASRMVPVWGIYFVLFSATYLLCLLYPCLPRSKSELLSVVMEISLFWLPLGLGFLIVNHSNQEHPSWNS